MDFAISIIQVLILILLMTKPKGWLSHVALLLISPQNDK